MFFWVLNVNGSGLSLAHRYWKYMSFCGSNSYFIASALGGRVLIVLKFPQTLSHGIDTVIDSDWLKLVSSEKKSTEGMQYQILD